MSDNDKPTDSRLWMAQPDDSQRDVPWRGNKLLFETPEILWANCCKYFQWAEDNPLYETKGFAYEGVVTQEPLPKMRAMTIAGLCVFLGITKMSWTNYRARDAFKEVCEFVDDIIYEQKFTGAAAGLLNHSIIARELGLSEKSEHTGKGGKALFDPTELYRLIVSGDTDTGIGHSNDVNDADFDATADSAVDSEG